MSHEKGTHLGGIDSIEAVRLRCVCDATSDCWHLRSSRGRPMPRDRRHVIWIHGKGPRSATRAVWELHTGRPVPRPFVVSRICESYDCVNPEHLKCWRKAKEIEQQIIDGRFMTPARRAALKRMQESRELVITPELRAWIIESRQSSMDLSHAFDVAASWIAEIRRQHREVSMRRSRSVFDAGVALSRLAA